MITETLKVGWEEAAYIHAKSYGHTGNLKALIKIARIGSGVDYLLTKVKLTDTERVELNDILNGES